MPQHRKQQPRVPPILVVLAVVAVAASVTYLVTDRLGGDGDGDQAADLSPGGDRSGDDDATTTAEATTTTTPPFDGWVDPASSGQPYGDQVQGILTFRGNPTRSYYGEG